MYLLWIVYLCAPKVLMLKPKSQYNSIQRWSLWEVIMSWQWMLTNGISALLGGSRGPPHPLLPSEDTEKKDAHEPGSRSSLGTESDIESVDTEWLDNWSWPF